MVRGIRILPPRLKSGSVVIVRLRIHPVEVSDVALQALPLLVMLDGFSDVAGAQRRVAAAAGVYQILELVLIKQFPIFGFDANVLMQVLVSHCLSPLSIQGAWRPSEPIGRSAKLRQARDRKT
ncbi:MAG: hypothetical protein RBT81_05715 [Gammaproteobacteria bacterium]|jgi:hypothetical protein|nr:hypothetical protein [Gammaproteobacteria bacterium]